MASHILGQVLRLLELDSRYSAWVSMDMLLNRDLIVDGLEAGHALPLRALSMKYISTPDSGLNPSCASCS